MSTDGLKSNFIAIDGVKSNSISLLGDKSIWILPSWRNSATPTQDPPQVILAIPQDAGYNPSPQVGGRLNVAIVYTAAHPAALYTSNCVVVVFHTTVPTATDNASLSVVVTCGKEM